MDKRSDDDTIRAALGRDDPAAVELIWQRYADDLLAYLSATLCCRHDAEDVLQTVFARIAGKHHKLARARCLNAYVYRIARNEAVSHRRRRLRDGKNAVPKAAWLVASEAAREQSDLVDLLAVALARLPESQRQVVVLKVYRDKTFQEIAQLLGISVNTAASRYRYGMERLRTLLKDH
ncbi:RNA polymerase sigma factor [Anaerobaca lacustris]|uniref:RNA polymerase sigma factor n=1 Tax=Anaerobaca lacustris TaxID=3044600 RepID=A0AAW6U271_9BACT|nr:RNA polymerase sigma factor [Sedimentisphaerales bacterium M17dextr]